MIKRKSSILTGLSSIETKLKFIGFKLKCKSKAIGQRAKLWLAMKNRKVD